jgi:hypothetical protein
MSYDPFRNYDAWLTTPPDQDGWEEDYCPECKKPYPAEWIALLENGSEAPAPWPFCSADCAGADESRAAEAAEAQAEADREIREFDLISLE